MMSNFLQQIQSLTHVQQKALLAKLPPLSMAQERLWFLQQLAPQKALFNLPLAIHMEGHLHIEALEESLNSIVQYHQTLRTAVIELHGQLVQIVLPFTRFSLPQQDLRHLPAPARTEQANKFIQQEAHRPLDLGQSDVFRASLLILGNKKYILLLNMHHMVADGWSLGVFVRQLSLLYQAFCNGTAIPFPLPTLQYTDFARWQRDWLQGEALRSLQTYWQQQLHKPLPVLDLPTDYARPATPEFPGERQTFHLPVELTQQLHRLSRLNNVTLFMTLLAAFKLLLHRYTGQNDIIVGTPVAGRNQAEWEDVIGFFVNTLPIRTNLTGITSFTELLEQVREVTLAAYAHQEMPFAELVQMVQPERSLQYNPLFQTMFALQNTPMPAPDLPGLQLNAREVHNGSAQFDLTFSLVETTQGLAGTVEYRSDLYHKDTVAQMWRHYQQLLTAIAAGPHQPLSQLHLLSTAEKQRNLAAWSGPRRAYPEPATVHGLFQQQVSRTPGETAVIWGDISLTYEELNQRANQLAHHLQNRGIKPEDRVGICLRSCPDMIIGLLGILKTGASYVPLDPDYPPQRLAHLLQDAQIALTLIHQADHDRLPVAHHDALICLDREWEHIVDFTRENLTVQVWPDNIAYVIYTSGSTGRPKGVMVSHGNLRNHALALKKILGLDKKQRLAQLSSFSFDAAAEEIFPTLLSGGTLILPGDATQLLGTSLWQLCAAANINILHLPAPVWHVGVQTLVDDNLYPPESLNLLLIGGDRPDPDKVQAWIERTPAHVRFLNAYGPTETTITTTLFATTNTELTDTNISRLPIGRPLPNVSAYVLDTNLHVMPVGTVGEIYIGGAGLARGYLHQPRLTAAQFMPDPFSHEPGARMYRTGDLGRYRQDGHLEFWGRIDDQVKIRGFRIEPGEIETTLRQHPLVRETHVLPYTNAKKISTLIAYVVPQSTAQPQSSEIQQFLRTKLPAHMVPPIFVLLDKIPLNNHGKVDRQALPKPDMAQPNNQALLATTHQTIPPTPVTEMVANIWAEVLDLPQVEVNDNFFELGGHSLLATQVVSRIRHTFGVEVPLRLMLQEPTVSELAQQIENLSNHPTDDPIPPIQKATRKETLPLSFAQQRLWFLAQLAPDSALYNIPIAVRLDGHLNVEAIAHSLEQIAARHETLRTTFKIVNGEPGQCIHPNGSIQFQPCDRETYAKTAYPLLDLQQLPEASRTEQAMRLLAEAARRPFDLAEGPLWRVMLLRLDTETTILFLNMHHIVSDGWSMGVFVGELAVLYQAFLRDEAADLPTLPWQYADFAVWQRQWLEGSPTLTKQLAYWQKQLAGPLPTLELPTDQPRSKRLTSHGATRSYTFSQSLTAELKALSRREGVTLFMTLLAAYKVLLFRYTGQTDILVGTPIANRRPQEAESLIGFFVNTLVLRTNLSGNPTFCTLLQQVREHTLAAYAHQDLPFERLVETLQPERDVNRSPLFQVMFTLQNAPMPTLTLPDVRLTPLTVDRNAAKFDLSVSIGETASGLLAQFEYNTELFEAATIERMQKHFHTLLQEIVRQPDRPLASLTLLPEGEQHLILQEWSGVQEHHEDKCFLHQLIERQVEQTPHAPAVLFEDQTLTYQELNERANQLANYLVTMGVGPETAVAIHIPRAIELIISVLAVLKAGGAFVPLEPGQPQARQAYMLANSGASVLLTQKSLPSDLPAFPGKTIFLDSLEKELAKRPGTNPDIQLTPDNLAYIFYTSGSTGRPKGVLNTHAGVVNYLTYLQKTYALSGEDIVLQLASFSFDASVRDLLGPLTTGAKVVLLPDEAVHDPLLLLKRIRQYDVTAILSIVPTLLRTLLTAARPETEPFSTLRLVLASGETLHWPDWEKAQAVFGEQLQLVNQYGPTECTMTSSYYPLLQPDTACVDVPIGRPIPNAFFYLLDDTLNPVPAGVTGNVYIGGAGLARGYAQQAGLTAQAFIPHPFSREPGARLYKTGDLACFHPDGTILFLGRRDNQVKLRGVRVELAEIETVLRQQPAVRDTAVTVHKNAEGDQQLIAYIVLHPGETVATSDLRNTLLSRLPAYMIPSAFFYIEALPRLPNGKLDRQALPAPDGERPTLDTAFVEPQTPVEEQLAAIWADVLKLSRVGIHDDFFELGGHSLLGAKVLARINQTFQMELPLRTLFEATTIADLALCIIQHELEREEELADLLAEIEELSPDETQNQLSEGGFSK